MAYFAASTDTPQKNKEFAESLGVDYPLLADPETKTAESYGVRIPILGLAKRWTFYIGKDGKIAAIDKAVKPPTSAEDVIAQLDALKVPKAH